MSNVSQAGKRKDILEKGAIVQRDRQTYAIAPHIPGGLLSKDLLLAYAALFDRYDIQAMKITGAQRIAIIGFRQEQLDQVWSELGMEPRNEMPAASLLVSESATAAPRFTTSFAGW